MRTAQRTRARTALLAAALSTGLAAGLTTACAEPTREAGRAAATDTPGSPTRPAPAPTVTVTETPTPTVTKTAPAPRPTVTRYVPPAPEDPASSFVDDYTSAGIRAPRDWATSTAEQVCAAWQAGSSADATDQILLEGGIYPWNVRRFSDIIERWYCPGAQP